MPWERWPPVDRKSRGFHSKPQRLAHNLLYTLLSHLPSSWQANICCPPLFTSPFILTFYSVRRHVIDGALLLSFVPAQCKQCLNVQRMGTSSQRNQSRPASLKEGWKSLSQLQRWVGSSVCLCACPDVPPLAHFALVFGFYAAFPTRDERGSVLLTPNNDSRNDMVWSRRRGRRPASAKCLEVQTAGFKDLWWWFHGIFLGIPLIFWHRCTHRYSQSISLLYSSLHTQKGFPSFSAFLIIIIPAMASALQVVHAIAVQHLSDFGHSCITAPLSSVLGPGPFFFFSLCPNSCNRCYIFEVNIIFSGTLLLSSPSRHSTSVRYHISIAVHSSWQAHFGTAAALLVTRGRLTWQHLASDNRLRCFWFFFFLSFSQKFKSRSLLQWFHLPAFMQLPLAANDLISISCGVWMRQEVLIRATRCMIHFCSHSRGHCAFCCSSSTFLFTLRRIYLISFVSKFGLFLQDLMEFILLPSKINFTKFGWCGNHSSRLMYIFASILSWMIYTIQTNIMWKKRPLGLLFSLFFLSTFNVFNIYTT